MSSFRIKLAGYFVLLSLLPVGAAFWGFSSLAGHDETRRSDTRLEAELRTTLASYQEQLDAAQARATRLARRSDLQRLLERRSRPGLARFLAVRPNVDVVMPGGVRVGTAPPAVSAQRTVKVLTRRGLVGTVVAYLPIDAQLARRLRARSVLGRGDVIAILRSSQVVASSPSIEGRITLAPGAPGPTAVGGLGYRALVAGPLREFAGGQIAVLTRQSQIDSANSSTRVRLNPSRLAALRKRWPISSAHGPAPFMRVAKSLS